MALDRIATRHSFGAGRPVELDPGRFDAVAAEGALGDERVLAFKPMTYMNESGRAVGSMMRWLKLEPARVIVFHDELDLPPGKLRTKRGGGNGGPNGPPPPEPRIG